MGDTITVNSTTGYGKRVGNSLKKIIGGILLVIGSICLLVRNENNFIKQKAALNEGSKIVTETVASPIDPQLDKKLVYLQGETYSPDDELFDEAFGIRTNDLKLQRTVEMYQWKESSSESCHDTVGGTEECRTTYDYRKVRDDDAIDSSRFYEAAGHRNPSNRKYTSESREKTPILLGDFSLTETFIQNLNDRIPLSLSGQNILTPQTTENLEEETVSGNIQYFHSGEKMLYLGKNPDDPRIGDLKITYTTVKTGSVSIVGQQNTKELTSYTTSNGRKIALLESGNVPVETMFANAHNANRMLSRFLRLLGLVLMYAGFSMMFEFLVTLAKVLPFLANILGVGVSIVALVLTLVVGLGTIAIAWLAVRPLLGVSLLILAIGGAIVVVKMKKNKKSDSEKNLASV